MVTHQELAKIYREAVKLFDPPLLANPKLAICGGGHLDPCTTAHYHASLNQICLNRYWVERGCVYGINGFRNTIRHELIHAWIYQHGIKDDRSHGREWTKKAIELGVDHGMRADLDYL
jgi:predicted SprT family Zn-dependent metalloprotease